VWLKSRSVATTNHALFDAVRGVGYNLRSNTTDAEAIPSPNNALTAFTSDGFTLGANDTSGAPDINYTIGGTYVGWNWKANGAGSSNTAGTITSTVSANTTSGFSIVTYTGTGSNATVGHGLGVDPKIIFVKRRNSTSDWSVYFFIDGLGAGVRYLLLNGTGGSVFDTTYWNSTPATTTVFSLGTSTNPNASGGTYVAYCFAPVAGYSAFGSYAGNGSTDGPFVFTNFRPKYVMVKRTDSTGWWHIWDTARNTYNLSNLVLFPNGSDAESTYTAPDPVIDMLSNGFKHRGNYSHVNASGGTYIYMALAENPFKYSLAR
jgi:hypothetical protein